MSYVGSLSWSMSDLAKQQRQDHTIGGAQIECLHPTSMLLFPARWSTPLTQRRGWHNGAGVFYISGKLFKGKTQTFI